MEHDRDPDAEPAGPPEPVGQGSSALYPAIRGIVADTVMQRSERCQGGSGLGLRRRFFLE